MREVEPEHAAGLPLEPPAGLPEVDAADAVQDGDGERVLSSLMPGLFTP